MTRLRQLMAGVRVRTTVAAGLVVGAALIIAGAGMVWQLRNTLTTNIRDAAELTALSIAESIEQGELRDPIAVGEEDEEFAQVVDAAEGVVASSTNLPDRTPVVDIAPNETKRVDVPSVEDYTFIVVGEQAILPDGRTQTVLVGRTLEPVAESVSAVLGPMAIGIPLLMLVVAAVTWVVVGRALAPVEAIRSEVQTISGQRLDRRVPVPPADDEIAHLAVTMNTMLDRLEEGRDRQRQLVSDASHELRSPIAAIRQHVEVALAHPEQSDGSELAEVVLAEDLRLQRMVEDLLLLTKIDEGTLALRRSQVDLDDIVLAEASRLRAADPRVRVDTRAVSACRVLGDEAHLERLVRNLTDNAIRHARTAIKVSLYEVDDDAVLTIDDDGAGVPVRDRERIFERFERLDEARDRDSGGTGLGLSIVREIAHAHRGTVTVSDAPTGGASFEVRLPLDTQG